MARRNFTTILLALLTSFVMMSAIFVQYGHHHHHNFCTVHHQSYEEFCLGHECDETPSGTTGHEAANDGCGLHLSDFDTRDACFQASVPTFNLPWFLCEFISYRLIQEPVLSSVGIYFPPCTIDFSSGFVVAAGLRGPPQS